MKLRLQLASFFQRVALHPAVTFPVGGAVILLPGEVMLPNGPIGGDVRFPG